MNGFHFNISPIQPLIRTKELGEINTKAIKNLSEQQLDLISNCLDIGVKKISPPKKVLLPEQA